MTRKDHNWESRIVVFCEATSNKTRNTVRNTFTFFGKLFEASPRFDFSLAISRLFVKKRQIFAVIFEEKNFVAVDALEHS